MCVCVCVCVYFLSMSHVSLLGGFAKVKAGVHRATGEKVRNICTYVYEKCLFLSMT